MLRVVGIDPGLKITGYACVHIHTGSIEPSLDQAGVFRFKSKDTLEFRLNQLHIDLCELFDETKPHVLAVEKLYAHYAHPRTAIIMGHARGIILLAAEQREIPVVHLPSTEVKKAITGNGHASKDQIQRAVQSQYNLPSLPEPPDVADAIAIATCHARRHALEMLNPGGPRPTPSRPA